MAESEDAEQVVDYYAILNVRKEVKICEAFGMKKEKLNF